MADFEVFDSHLEEYYDMVYYKILAPFSVQDREFMQKRITLKDYSHKGQVLKSTYADNLGKFNTISQNGYSHYQKGGPNPPPGEDFSSYNDEEKSGGSISPPVIITHIN